jgi:polyisoprenoid-binding protein YceI
MTAPATTTTTTTWNIDHTHTSAQFAVKHLMITTVKGHFGAVAGTVILDQAKPTAPTIDVTIDVKSINTNNEQRDAHLRSADFFDVEKFPTIHFAGGKAEGDASGEFRLTGKLTMHGVTRDVTLDVTHEGQGADPWGGQRAGYSAATKIRRSDWGLTWNQALEAGGVVVGDEVKISIDVELVKA